MFELAFAGEIGAEGLLSGVDDADDDRVVDDAGVVGDARVVGGA